MKRIGLNLLLIMIVLPICAVIPTSTDSYRGSYYDKFNTLDADLDIISRYGLYESSTLQTFIDEKGDALNRIANQPSAQVNFRILDSPVPNAFALPDGHIYLTRGLLAHLNSEAEFAGILAHQIAHLASRHSQKHYEEFTEETELAPVDQNAKHYFTHRDLDAKPGAKLLQMRFGEEAERHCDELGVEYATKLGYDAAHMTHFLKRITKLRVKSGKDQTRTPGFSYTHGSPEAREQTVLKLCSKWQKRTDPDRYVVNREEYLTLIDGMVYGENPRKGFVYNETFFHPDLRISFPTPRGWMIETTSAQVNMTCPVADEVIVMKHFESPSLVDGVNKMLSMYSLFVLGSERLTIDGFNAVRVRARYEEGTQTFEALLHVIHDGSKAYAFIGASSPEVYATFEPVAYKVGLGFKRLMDVSRLNIEPKRIQIAEVKKDATFSEALSDLQVADAEKAEHAILNGIQLTDRVKSGMLVKIIE